MTELRYLFQNNVLHYLSDGGIKLMFNVDKELFFVPLMMVMKALVDVTDEFIYKQCLAGYEEDLYMKGYAFYYMDE